MNKELKKRKIIDAIKHYARKPFAVSVTENEAIVNIIPEDLKVDDTGKYMSYDELGELLLEIEQESKGQITIKNVNDRSFATSYSEKGEGLYSVSQYQVIYRKKESNKDKKITLILSPDGTLTYHAGTEYRKVSLKDTKLLLVKYLAENPEPSPTTDIANHIEKTKKYVREEIRELRNLIEVEFGINSFDFIPKGVEGEGYRLGKDIKILSK